MGRNTLSQCFEQARIRFEKEVVGPLNRDDKRAEAAKSFLNGAKLEELERACKDLSTKAEEKATNTASRLLTTIEQFKGAADIFLQYAPESVSIVWFGISSLISRQGGNKAFNMRDMR
ncbi:hypothetical protein ABW20_dc0108018 [Dactylellina cionopaga]|nr:hypothetical protein ABW20_dc0108018 [Dactylellina cionopaga]